MNKRLLVGSFLSLLVAFLTPAGATTVVPPADLGQLARMSETVTFAIAVESWVESGDTIPFTVTRFHLLQTVAGAGTDPAPPPVPAAPRLAAELIRLRRSRIFWILAFLSSILRASSRQAFA